VVSVNNPLVTEVPDGHVANVLVFACIFIQVSLPVPMAPSQQSHMAVAQPPPLVRVTGAPPTIG